MTSGRPEVLDIQQLVVDISNPRLPDGEYTQQSAMAKIVSDSPARFMAHCRHIAENGLNPAQTFLATKEGDDFVVLDGNRRLAVLKALEQPDLLENTLGKSRLKALIELAAAYRPQRSVPCVVFDHREDAEPWIELLHTSPADGTGVITWGSLQKARFRARSGQPPLHVQVLDAVAASSLVSEKTADLQRSGKFRSSTLQRIVDWRGFAPMLGIEVENGAMRTTLPGEAVLKALARIVEDIGQGEQTSRTLHTRDQLRVYLEGLPEVAALRDLPRNADAAPLRSKPAGGRGRRATRDRPATDARKQMIPPTLALSIEQSRIHDIYRELKHEITLATMPNAAGMVLRQFLEMSFAHFIRHTPGLSLKRTENFEQNAGTVIDHLEQKGKFDKNEAKALRHAVNEPRSALTTLHAVVHNPDFAVTAPELIRLWDRFEPLVRQLWQVASEPVK